MILEISADFVFLIHFDPFHRLLNHPLEPMVLYWIDSC